MSIFGFKQNMQYKYIWSMFAKQFHCIRCEHFLDLGRSCQNLGEILSAQVLGAQDSALGAGGDGRRLIL